MFDLCRKGKGPAGNRRQDMWGEKGMRAMYCGRPSLHPCDPDGCAPVGSSNWKGWMKETVREQGNQGSLEHLLQARSERMLQPTPRPRRRPIL